LIQQEDPDRNISLNTNQKLTKDFTKIPQSCCSDIHILLAEDNEINQEVAYEIINQAGLQCDIAENGRKAVEAVLSGNHDLVLMDCAMPEMDGFEATRVIRQKEEEGHVTARNGGHIPIIALTANAVKGDRELCLNAGMDNYISKPFEAFELISMITKYVSSSESTTEQNMENLTTESGEESIVVNPAPSESSKPIDFDSFLHRCMGNTAVMKKILDLFENKIKENLDQISESVRAVDAEQIALLSHALKGAAGNISAEPLREIAAQLEKIGRSGDLKLAENMLQTLRSEVENCLAYLPQAEDFIKENQ